jgi:hypothetical protein
MASNYDRPRTEPAFVNEIEAAAIIELVVWLSVLQMLHRLGRTIGPKHLLNASHRKAVLPR